MLNTKICIATLSLEKRWNAQMHRKRYGAISANTLGLQQLHRHSHQCFLDVVAWSQPLGHVKQKCKAALTHQCFFCFCNLSKPSKRNDGAFCKPCNEQELYSSKTSIFSFVPARCWILHLRNTKTFTNAYFRKCIIRWNDDVLKFRQVWITTKKAYNESGGQAACIHNDLPRESQFQSLVFDLYLKCGFAKNKMSNATWKNLVSLCFCQTCPMLPVSHKLSCHA